MTRSDDKTMPTGYTADVESGKVTDFRTFALRCARNFGACIMQRDDPMEEPPKHREPTDWHAREIAKAKERLTYLANLTTREAKREAEAAYNKALASYEEYAALEREQNARFDAMAEKVRAWEPPTAHHVGMKDFMLDQLRISRHDYYTSGEDRPKRLSAEEWLAEEQRKARRDIEYHAKEHEAELARCAQSNAWIDALYESLNEQVPA